MQLGVIIDTRDAHVGVFAFDKSGSHDEVWVNNVPDGELPGRPIGSGLGHTDLQWI